MQDCIKVNDGCLRGMALHKLQQMVRLSTCKGMKQLDTLSKLTGKCMVGAEAW